MDDEEYRFAPPAPKNTSIDWPELDLTELPFSYLLHRMEKDRDSTASLINFLRRQAKNEEKYCSGLAKCFEEPKTQNNILGSLQSIGRDLLGEQNLTFALADSESTSGYLHTIRQALSDYAKDRRKFAKFIDSILCSTLEKHVNARSRMYDALKRERNTIARNDEEARRRLENAKSTLARLKKEENKEGIEIAAVGQREEDKTSDAYLKKLQKFKDTCMRCNKAAEVCKEQEKAGMQTEKQLRHVYRKIARNVKSQEVDRIYDTLSVLGHCIQLEKNSYERRIKQLTELERKLAVVDPFSDLRLFAHNCKVNELLKKSPFMTKKEREKRSALKKERNAKETHKQVVVDKFLDAVFEWRRAGVEKSSAEAQLSLELEGTTMSALAAQLVDSFNTQPGRDLFIRGLNRQRGAQKDVGIYFDVLAETLEALLDACVRHMDVDNCNMVMIMSQTFFRVHPTSPTGKEYIVVDGKGGGDSGDKNKQVKSGEKEFMQERVQQHPIWHDLTYWEEILLRGVRAEVERNCPRRPPEKVQYVYQQIVAAQLRGVVFNMAAFGVPLSLTATLIQRTAIAARMGDDEVEQLMKAAARPQRKRRASSESGSSAAAASTTTSKSKSADNASEKKQPAKVGLTVETRDATEDGVVEVLTPFAGSETDPQSAGTQEPEPNANIPVGDDDDVEVSIEVEGDVAVVSSSRKNSDNVDVTVEVDEADPSASSVETPHSESADDAADLATDIELSMWL